MLHRFVLHNDRIRDAADPLLCAGQVGLLSGWGVFSTLRIVDRVPFAFAAHHATYLAGLLTGIGRGVLGAAAR